MAGFDTVPLWIIGIALILVLSFVIEAGYQVGQRATKEHGMNKHPVEAAVTSALLALMAFMTAFTFGSSISRYTASRDLAVSDANQVATLYRMAAYLPEGDRAKARSLVREYLELRLTAINSQDAEKLDVAIARSAEIHERLWTIGATDRPAQDNARASSFVATLVKVIETDAARQAAALANRIPRAIWITLGMLAVLAVGLLGLSSGLHGRRSRIVATVFIVAYSTVFVLIVDLDRPFRSIFRLGDPAAERALESMK